MKTFLLLILLAGITTSFSQDKLGKEITLKDKTPITSIVENPKDFVGKTVLVEGTVTDVCKEMGCWMMMSDGKKEIKIKVKDGDIVFPVELVGRTAVAEGTVYEINLTQEQAVEFYEHVAEESGKPFDPATVTGPVTIYQIKGLGAEILAAAPVIERAPVEVTTPVEEKK